MKPSELQAFVDQNASELGVTGVAVGVYQDGRETYAFHGVTSVENPLPVNDHTLFQYGSTHKTFTATAIMILVDRGLLSLDDKVRKHVPELRLKDEECAANVTILHLLNHTAGWSGDAHEDCGDGDDCRAIFVERMANLEQVTPLGSAVSYNNASLNLAGRVIEKVTGKVYEQAMKELLYEPLGLNNTFFFPNDVMTRRFAVGHLQRPDGTLTVARPWALPRAGAPAGGFGVSATAPDQISWARFHLGDGRAPNGTRILSKELLELMKEPTVKMPGSALGDAVGISWLLADLGPVRLVGHGGTTIGQYSNFTLVPQHNFAFTSMTNCGPNGSQLNRRIEEWVLETCLGIRAPQPEPVTLTDDRLAEYAGRYETIAVWADIAPHEGGLLLTVTMKPETIEQLRQQGEEIPEQPPIPLKLLSGGGDRYVVSDGPAKGMKGYFVRGPSGRIEAVHVGGRLAMKATAPAHVT